jgi:hypothetical protein
MQAVSQAGGGLLLLHKKRAAMMQQQQPAFSFNFLSVTGWNMEGRKTTGIPHKHESQERF